MARLRLSIPDALVRIGEGCAGPFGMAQAAIGPGIGVFTPVANTLRPDDTPMSVRVAVALISWVPDEFSGEEARSCDPEIRFYIGRFDIFGTLDGKSGEANTLAHTLAQTIACARWPWAVTSRC